MGMIYPIKDSLRGHPQKPHGTQPPKFVGFWIREETVMFDFVGEAFYLMPDGTFAGRSGMTSRHWHFDNNRLFVDSISRCGNCDRGNVTTEYTVNFVDSEQLLITNRDKSAKRGIGGTYRMVKITDDLKANLARMQESKDEDKSFKARCAIAAIEQFESLSNLKQ